MSLLTAQDWSFPVPIRYGPNRIREIAEICHQQGISSPLIVTDQGSANMPFVAAMQNDLTGAGMSPGLFAGISPNPRDKDIIRGREVFRNGGHDGVIALGGGSGMDGGKAISLLAHNAVDIWAFEYEKPPIEQKDYVAFPPLICVPTTAGTGAETESTAMVTDTEKMMKWCIWHPHQKPASVILDPVLTVGLPRHLTAWTGVDALVHAIEAYVVESFHPLCDGAALEALRLIYRHLPVVVDQPDDLEARGALLVGSCLAGVSFIKGLGLVHAISHMVGAENDTHHGLTNAVLLPSVMRFNASAIGKKIPAMAQACGLDDHSFDGFYQAVCRLLDQLYIPRDLKELKVPDSGFDRLAQKAVQDSGASTNPRSATADEIETIIREAFDHGR